MPALNYQVYSFKYYYLYLHTFSSESEYISFLEKLGPVLWMSFRGTITIRTLKISL